MKERVQKLMAQANIGSRRACETIIEEGRVRVNGEVITIGDKADPETDTIEVDGRQINVQTQNVYIAVNKPINVLSSNAKHRKDDRPTVRSLVSYRGHLFTIGRLDAESEGLIVLTNDGDLTHRLTHPRYEHTKTYIAVVYGRPNGEVLKKWQEGIYLGEEDGRTAPCVVEHIGHNGGLSTLRITMSEGKNRQIRRIASRLGFPVRKLVRTHIGQLDLDRMNLRPGENRALKPEELEALKKRAPDFKRSLNDRTTRRRTNYKGRRQGGKNRRKRR